MVLPLTPEQIAQRKIDFIELFESFGVKGINIDYFLRKRNQWSIKAVRDRLQAMVDNGVPLRGILYKVSMTSKDFNALLERYEGEEKFSQIQQAMYDYLILKKISKNVALKLAKHKFPTRLDLEAKIKYFESIQLDEELYGSTKIPVRVYENFLEIQFSIIKRFKKTILRKVANEHAKKWLDRKFPGWRKDPRFRKTKPYKAYLRYILGKSAGLQTTADFITRYPLKRRNFSGISPSGKHLSPPLVKLAMGRF